jgi:hypothetical protein
MRIDVKRITQSIVMGLWAASAAPVVMRFYAIRIAL